MKADDVNIVSYTDEIFKIFSKQRPLRVGSFIMTLYGDAFLYRNNGIWTGHIIDICKSLKISESLTRTTISRLMAKKRLTGIKDGRKSYYHLTNHSMDEFKAVAKNLYCEKPQLTDIWTFVINLDITQRDEMKRRLETQGFGSPIYGVYMKPNDHINQINLAFKGGLNNGGNIIFTAKLNAKLNYLTNDKININLLADAWDLEILDKKYQDFCLTFSPILQFLKNGQKLNDSNSFLLRQIMVHKYRLIALKDPYLPSEMLPDSWLGHKVFNLFSEIYKALLCPSETFLNNLLNDMNAPIFFQNANEISIIERKLELLNQ